MKGDFTRFTFRQEKHYSSVRKQQGRVDLDADWNEQLDITDHRVETEALDIIGPSGVPKHGGGFNLTPAGGDFTIGAGRIYVAGILCENDADVSYTTQTDLPATPALNATGRYLVYLDVWERHLTALDDPEIREVALGGPDTATRTKTVWQVKTAAVGATDTCATSPQPWPDASTGKLSARAQPDDPSDKPCILPPGAGYRRLENQLYRVEIHDPGVIGSAGATPTFKWSRDNGCVVAAIDSIASNEITVASARFDSATGFAPGQWVEVTDDNLELNGLPGELIQIQSVVVATNTITLLSAPTSPFHKESHPKLRRWDSDGATPVSIPAGNDGFLALEDGVEVRFENGTYRTGDYWVIPARTDHGDVEWPQNSATPSKPVPQGARGITHHYARLGIIDFTESPAAVTLVEDCRTLFPPLTEIGAGACCCTYTVSTTGGDFATITEAIAHLPVTGGEICVLPGEYTDNVLIANMANVTIHGCGVRTKVASAAPASGSAAAPPVFTISNSRNIKIDSLEIDADPTGIGILVGPIDEKSTPGSTDETFATTGKNGPSVEIHLTELKITAAQQSAIEIHEARFVIIDDCLIEMLAPFGHKPAIFFSGDYAEIAHNYIAGATVARRDADIAREISASKPFAGGVSGIQLGGRSEHVRVAENLIQNVSGQGITLGSIDETDGKTTVTVVGWPTNPDDPCDPCRPPGLIGWEPGRPTRTSSGDLYWIKIVDNLISGTGFDGIGVAGFFDLSKADEFISVHDLTIEENGIRECLTRSIAPTTTAVVDSMGYGGIALADVESLTIRGNVVEDNSIDQPTATCGIFVLHGEGIDITDNHILNNGRAITPEEAKSVIGRRGGINIVYAVSPPVAPSGSAFTTTETEIKLTTAKGFNAVAPSGFPAATIHGNIVDAPLGRALTIVALGPVSVVDNQLSTRDILPDSPISFTNPATVLIGNLGISNEWYGQLLLFKNLTVEPRPQQGFDDLGLGRYLANGNVMFNNNQCSLDLIGSRADVAFSSIAIFTLDDVAMQNNQSDCNMVPRQDFVVTNAFVMGVSLRFSDNRLKEGVLNAVWSGWTIGMLNQTIDNQATHCILPQGPLAWLLNQGNTIFISGIIKGYCSESLRETAGNFAILNQR